MDNSILRTFAKIVACVDMVVLCINYILLLYVYFQEAGYMRENWSFSYDDGDNVLLKLILVMCVMFILIQFWAAYNLLDSTNLEKEPKQALKQLRIWITVTLVFSSLSVVACVIRHHARVLSFTVIWRIISFVVIYKFRNVINIQEEEENAIEDL